MSPCRLLAFVLLPALVHGADDFAAWTHRQSVAVPQPGLTRLELDPALLEASKSNGGQPFNDLRLTNPAGVEMPFAILLPSSWKPTFETAADFKTTLADGATILDFQAPRRGEMTEVQLQTAAYGFIKAATLEASAGGSNWQQLSSGNLICRQQGTERLALTLPPGAGPHFRITLDDRRSGRVVFTGAQIRYETPNLTSVAHPVTIQSRKDEQGDTRLTLNLGTANVLLAAIRIHTPEAVFQREVSLLDARATLFRLQHEGLSAEQLSLEVHQRAPHREVELVIHNGDSPPLRIDRLEGSRHPVPILFHADVAGDWRLFIGNAQAPAPRYDTASLASKLSDAPTRTVTAGGIEANPAFRKTATAPQVGEGGAPLDVSEWSFRKTVVFHEAGVVDVELDTAVLARAQPDLRDLRLIRDGRQLPFLIQRSEEKHTTQASFAEVPDPKRPNQSRWEIALPFEGFPASGLVLESSTPLFERYLNVVEHVDTDQGRIARTIGFARWQRTPGSATASLHLPVTTSPKGSLIELTTDNGDNPALQLTSVGLLHPVVRVQFRVNDTAPVHLCYGNRNASFVRYDVALVRDQFATATKIPATLGDEEKLAGFKASRKAGAGAGSPWLWAVLAVVVGGLLWLIAKMLPKAEPVG